LQFWMTQPASAAFDMVSALIRSTSAARVVTVTVNLGI